MKRTPKHKQINEIFIKKWTVCHICKNEFKKEPMWMALKPGAITPRLFPFYVCKECKPTMSEAVEYFNNDFIVWPKPPAPVKPPIINKIISEDSAFNSMNAAKRRGKR